MFKHILAPVDGSLASHAGMLQAIGFAKEQKAKLRFVHVLDTYFPIYDLAGDFNIAGMLDALHDVGRKILKDAESLAGKEGVNADSVMVEAVGGRVAEFIVEQARHWPADLIVMGTHGRRGFSHFVLGSNAEAVSRMSPIPVLLVRSAQVEGGAP